MDRRAFFGWIGVGMLASSLPVVIAACTDSETTTETPPPPPGGTGDSPPIDTSPREDGFQAFGTVEQLDADGTIENKTADVLIFRNPDNNNEIAAVNSLCPHQGCTVEWQSDLKIFACPCHGSKFAPDGSVNTGPAKKPLPNFETKQEGDVILVKVS